MTLHPQVRERLEQAARAAAAPLYTLSPAVARERASAMKAAVGPGPAADEVRDVVVPSPWGGVPARMYRPAPEPGAGVCVFLHGGGWMIGSVDDFDAVCRSLAVESGFEVLSVDYRLAPEHPFPAAVEDAFAALCWAAADACAGRPLVVAGESAGGNLAAACALMARDHGAPKIALQVLVCPITGADFDTESYRLHGDAGFSVGRREMMWFWDHYAPDRDARSDPRACPILADDLRGVAPAYVVVAEYDALRDDGLGYARRLRDAGVPVTLRYYDDVTHGFFALANLLERGREAVLDAAAAISATAAQRA